MTEAGAAPEQTTPSEPLGRLFLRFLRFGALAWGGPVAQIAMIRQELVEEERWISPARFNRVLAVYQVLPGPEAHELCVYFGMRSRGRVGGLLAGLGFMLPGFVLMFALSAAYVRFGLRATSLGAAFLGCQPAVIALIVRAVQRIGSHALRDRALLVIALASAVATLAGFGFAPVLGAAGVAYALLRGRAAHVAAFVPLVASVPAAVLAPGLLALFVTGLHSGLLTFGGAYTVIPFLRADAVGSGGWMSDAQFLDGLALSGILPAPLVIFSTFVGYLGGGAAGALAVTAGVFLPAFGVTLIGHGAVERLVEQRRTHAFLDGVTAGVVGLIAVTALELARGALLPQGRPAPAAIAIFAAALFAAFRWKARTAVAWIVAGAALAGALWMR